MARVLVGMTVSLDGFVNDRHGSVDRLYPDLEALRETEMLQDSMRVTGAVVMGRRAYDMAAGDLTGYEYQVPIFVLTHQPPAQGAKGGLKITFVTDGIESAIAQAKRAAGDHDVTVVGGPSTMQQCISAGLADELHIGLVPALLGGGLRMFDSIAADPIELEKISVQESPGRIDVRFRFVNRG